MAYIYTPKLWDHLRNPRNLGFLKDADVMAQAEDPESGIAVLCLLKIEGETVQEMRFLAKGCSLALAASSVVTELVRGKSLDEALALDGLAVEEALGGFPTEKMCCRQLPLTALHAAVHEYRADLEPSSPLLDDPPPFPSRVAHLKRLA